MSVMDKFMAMLGLQDPVPKEHLLTVADRRRMAWRPPSFTALLPYASYAPDEQVFVMEDGVTFGALFELAAVATEAQPMSPQVHGVVQPCLDPTQTVGNRSPGIQ